MIFKESFIHGRKLTLSIIREKVGTPVRASGLVPLAVVPRGNYYLYYLSYSSIYSG
jgi:hypothetical protein